MILLARIDTVNETKTMKPQAECSCWIQFRTSISLCAWTHETEKVRKFWMFEWRLTNLQFRPPKIRIRRNMAVVREQKGPIHTCISKNQGAFEFYKWGCWGGGARGRWLLFDNDTVPNIWHKAQRVWRQFVSPLAIFRRHSVRCEVGCCLKTKLRINEDNLNGWRAHFETLSEMKHVNSHTSTWTCRASFLQRACSDADSAVSGQLLITTGDACVENGNSWKGGRPPCYRYVTTVTS